MSNDAIPTKLFKYVGVGGKAIFENGRILFRRPKYLNDPFDFAPKVLPLTDKELDEHAKEIAGRRWAFREGIVPPWEFYWKRARPELVEKLRAEWKKHIPSAPFMIQGSLNISLLCLTETENDLLMWAHYAEGHRGFLIEFNPQEDFFSGSKLRQVAYQDFRPVVSLSSAKHSSCYLVKGEDWKREAEWRMFKDWRRAPAKLNEEGGLFDLPATAVKRVILGFRMAADVSQEIRLLLKKVIYRDVQVQVAEPDPDTFALRYRDVT